MRDLHRGLHEVSWGVCTRVSHGCFARGACMRVALGPPPLVRGSSGGRCSQQGTYQGFARGYPRLSHEEGSRTRLGCWRR